MLWGWGSTLAGSGGWVCAADRGRCPRLLDGSPAGCGVGRWGRPAVGVRGLAFRSCRRDECSCGLDFCCRGLAYGSCGRHFCSRRRGFGRCGRAFCHRRRHFCRRRRGFCRRRRGFCSCRRAARVGVNRLHRVRGPFHAVREGCDVWVGGWRCGWCWWGLGVFAGANMGIPQRIEGVSGGMGVGRLCELGSAKERLSPQSVGPARPILVARVPRSTTARQGEQTWGSFLTPASASSSSTRPI